MRKYPNGRSPVHNAVELRRYSKRSPEKKKKKKKKKKFDTRWATRVTKALLRRALLRRVFDDGRSPSRIRLLRDKIAEFSGGLVKD